MSNLAKWVEIKRLENAERERRLADVKAIPGGEVTILRHAPVCYIPGICSKSRRPILFRCTYSTDHHTYICVELLLADAMSAREAANQRHEYAKGQKVSWACPLGLRCPGCKTVVNRLSSGGGGCWHCECGAINCFGARRVSDGRLYITCGSCGVEGYLGDEFHTEPNDAYLERRKEQPQSAGALGSGNGLTRR